MNQDEYERSKTRLAEQRRSAIEMVEAGFQAQLKALELYWSLHTEKSEITEPTVVKINGLAAVPPSGQAPSPAKETEPRRSAPEVDSDVRETFPLLPETFTRHDVCRVLGYTPYRGALYLSLHKLVQKGLTRVLEEGSGHRAAVYQKTGNPPPSS